MGKSLPKVNRKRKLQFVARSEALDWFDLLQQKAKVRERRERRLQRDHKDHAALGYDVSSMYA